MRFNRADAHRRLDANSDRTASASVSEVTLRSAVTVTTSAEAVISSIRWVYQHLVVPCKRPGAQTLARRPHIPVTNLEYDPSAGRRKYRGEYRNDFQVRCSRRSTHCSGTHCSISLLAGRSTSASWTCRTTLEWHSRSDRRTRWRSCGGPPIVATEGTTPELTPGA